MDELKISTTFTRGLIKKIIHRVVKKKLGVDIGVDVLELHAIVPPATADDEAREKRRPQPTSTTICKA